MPKTAEAPCSTQCFALLKIRAQPTSEALIADRRLAQIERRIGKVKTLLSSLGEMLLGMLKRQFKNPQNQTCLYCQLSYTLNMKSRTDYVFKDALAEVRQQVAKYKRFKELCAQWWTWVLSTPK